MRYEAIQTKMIFRRWRNNQEIIALLPEEPADPNGYLCQSYEHIGQHGAADYAHVIAKTTPITREDASSDLLQLMDELNALGYQIAWRQRCTPTMRHARQQKTDYINVYVS